MRVTKTGICGLHVDPSHCIAESVKMNSEDFREVSSGLVREHKENATWWIPDINQLYTTQENAKRTKEIYLHNLGHFPSAEPVTELMEQSVFIDGTELRVPDFLKESHIPAFYSLDGNSAWLSLPALAAARYIYSLWEIRFFEREQVNTDEEEILSGFFIIHSFAGGQQ